MKKILLILTLTISVSIFTYAKDIDSTTAMNIAKKFYTENATIKKSLNKNNIGLSLAYTCKYENIDGISTLINENLYYIFNVNSNDGFVIVAADDIVSPILGYSNEGTFTTLNMPPDFQWWMDGYKKQIAYAKENKIEATDDISTKWNNLISTDKNLPMPKTSSVSPLTHTTWDQSPNYNALCPGGSVTGCVATAMAQIMRYWNFPPHGIGSHIYTDQNYGIQSVNFTTTTYNWSSMPLSVTSANTPVATLMYDCGVSVNMSYSPSGSGAYVTSGESPIQNCAEYAFKTYFGYNPSTVLGIQYSNYSYPYTQIKTILENDLNNNRPVQYGGVDVTNGGHSWVCDGYDVNELFHMNWGWSGQYNGYFDIIALNPSTFAFDTMQEIITGIIPDTVGAPSTNFSAVTTSSTCSGVIQFNDLSLPFATSWHWNFGDGTTSNSENPSHTYSSSGTYSVKLVVTNNDGADSLTKTNYITISLPASPTVNNSVICDSGSTTLTASGTGILNWYNSLAGGTIINTGTSFITPVLTTTTTYYVNNEMTSPPVYGAKPNNSGGGGYLTNQNQYLLFDCYTALTLVSVDIYASSTGQRTIELRNSSGTILDSAIVAVNATGLNTVTLNFPVPAGSNLILRLSPISTSNLYRNNAGVSYPYTTAGAFSITGSSADTTHYYYFYNWKIQGSSCFSSRNPVIAQVLQSPVAGFNYSAASNYVTFNNTSVDATSYLWNFGDGDTSAQANTSHTYSANGNYTISLTATNSCGQNVSVQSVNVIGTDIKNLSSDNYFEIFPNPSNGIFNINALSDGSKNIQINIFNIQGKKIFSQNIAIDGKEISKTINLSNFEKGVYHLELISKSQIKNKIIILQ